MKKVFVEIRPKVTRLGNWLFQYAAAKSAAPEGEVVFVIQDRNDWPAVEKYRELFPEVTITDEEPDDKSLLRTGLYQDAKYLDREVVKNLFTVRESYRGQIASGMVSIHVRRGDYLKLPHRHPFVGETYLREAIAGFPKGTSFMIFSDDVPWCRKFFTGDEFHFSPGTSALDDLFLMSWCDHHICSNSTFSWWGAYLRGGGRTIFPAMWYGPAIRDEDWCGLYFDGCEVLTNGYSVRRWLLARLLMAKNACGNLLRKAGLR